MIESLDCPSCGGPLEHKSVSSATLDCSFCGNSVVVPERLRPARAEAAKVYVRPADSPRNRLQPAGVAITIAVAVGLAVAFFAYRSSRQSSSPPQQITTPLASTPKPAQPRAEKSQPAGLASVALTFGGEGIGPGLFKDARSIALDGAGNIYVGEYTGGRVQVFDAAGKFVTQWMADAKMPLRGMAADRKGRVYVVQSGRITRYVGSTGERMDEMDYPGGWGFDDVAVTADGGMVASWYRNRDDIVRFDAAGKTRLTIRSAISSQTDSSELQTRLAVDGLGNIYALGEFSNAVFKFSPEGKYITRFGSAGDAPGQLRAPGAIAVDNQGRVFVADFKGVQVFDGDGRYVGLIKVEGAASGIAFNDDTEMFVVARTRVSKYTLGKL